MGATVRVGLDSQALGIFPRALSSVFKKLHHLRSIVPDHNLVNKYWCYYPVMGMKPQVSASDYHSCLPAANSDYIGFPPQVAGKPWGGKGVSVWCFPGGHTEVLGVESRGTVPFRAPGHPGNVRRAFKSTYAACAGRRKTACLGSVWERLRNPAALNQRGCKAVSVRPNGSQRGL